MVTVIDGAKGLNEACVPQICPSIRASCQARGDWSWKQPQGPQTQLNLAIANQRGFSREPEQVRKLSLTWTLIHQ